MLGILQDLARQRANAAAGAGGLITSAGNYAAENPQTVGLLAGQFAPSAGYLDFTGNYPDPMNPTQLLPSASQNLRQGNYFDAGAQTLGLIGDAMYAAAPFTGGLTSLPAMALAVPRATQLAKRAKPLTNSEKKSQNIIGLLKSGRADEVTDEMLELADTDYLNKNYDLPMDIESRTNRAEEMGFNVDVPMYHGTNSDEIIAFDDKYIGLVNDEGFYGRGHYFTPYQGEAGFYGKNVGKYNLKGNFLDLTRTDARGDGTLGDPKYFKWWANELDKLGVLDEGTKKAVKTLEDIDEYIDKNISFAKMINNDGTEGYIASIKNPIYETSDIHTPFKSPYLPQQVPLSKEGAKDSAKRRFINDMTTTYKYAENNPYKGLEDVSFSLSDYIRLSGKAGELSKKASKAGYDGIRVGDETVVFNPKNVRLPDARFDPRLQNLRNLKAGVALPLVIGGGATGLLMNQEQDPNNNVGIMGF